MSNAEVPRLSSHSVTWQTIGTSVEGREIRVALKSGSGRVEKGGVLFIGGLHGDERATVTLLEEFCEQTLSRANFPQPVAIIPLANPDSHQHDSRYNVRGVDLNRNCDHRWSAASVEPSGPHPWSEPEICALRDFILEWKPRSVVALHWALAEIDADGEQSQPLAEAMWEGLPLKWKAPYRLRVADSGLEKAPDEGLYTACPGSLGQWCGYKLQYEDGSRPAMVTLELPYDTSGAPRPEVLPEDHVATLKDLWRQDAEAYLNAIRPGVFSLLLTACGFLAARE